MDDFVARLLTLVESARAWPADDARDVVARWARTNGIPDGTRVVQASAMKYGTMLTSIDLFWPAEWARFEKEFIEGDAPIYFCLQGCKSPVRWRDVTATIIADPLVIAVMRMQEGLITNRIKMGLPFGDRGVDGEASLLAAEDAQLAKEAAAAQ